MSLAGVQSAISLHVDLPVGIAMSCMACIQNSQPKRAAKCTTCACRAPRDEYLTGADKGFVDAKKTFAFQLDDCAVLKIAHGRLAGGK